ncbi:MAG: LytTR family transcriptional regulator [Odoribacter sp.]|nr:LytTR family transcriptional regulator [Odoribacter sp.]
MNEVRIFIVSLSNDEETSVKEITTLYECLDEAGVEDISTIKEVVWEMMEKDACVGAIFSIKENGIYRTYSQYDVKYIKAAGSSSEIVFYNGKVIVLSYRLAVVTKWFAEKLFVRIHRSFLINVNYITGFTPGVVFVGDEEYKIGGMYKADFFMKMKICGNLRLLLKKAAK